MTRRRVALPALLSILLVGTALAVPEGWMKSLEEGRRAAARSGKPILLITAWKPEV